MHSKRSILILLILFVRQNTKQYLVHEIEFMKPVAINPLAKLTNI